jgi:hypothetical protein
MGWFIFDAKNMSREAVRTAVMAAAAGTWFWKWNPT